MGGTDSGGGGGGGPWMNVRLSVVERVCNRGDFSGGAGAARFSEGTWGIVLRLLIATLVFDLVASAASCFAAAKSDTILQPKPQETVCGIGILKREKFFIQHIGAK